MALGEFMTGWLYFQYFMVTVHGKPSSSK